MLFLSSSSLSAFMIYDLRPRRKIRLTTSSLFRQWRSYPEKSLEFQTLESSSNEKTRRTAFISSLFYQEHELKCDTNIHPHSQQSGEQQQLLCRALSPVVLIAGFELIISTIKYFHYIAINASIFSVVFTCCGS